MTRDGPRVEVDGLRLALPGGDLGLPDARPGPIDFTVELVRGPAEAAAAGARPTGDASFDGATWAAFARRGGERLVTLRGVGCLVADPAARAARVVHDAGPARDRAVLRRLAPYLGDLAGRLVLHAATVVAGDGAHVIVAASGTGKSTLALALDAAGFAVLGDDHVALTVGDDGRFVAHPSFPFADADGPARRAVGAGRAGEAAKASVAFASARPRSAPVVALDFLRRGPAVAARRMKGADAAAGLLAEAVFAADPADAVATVRHLDATVRLAASVPAFQVEVPEGLDRLAEAVAAWPPRITGGPGAPGS